MMLIVLAMLLAQPQPPVATEVKADGTVIFRLRAPNAQSVKVQIGELKVNQALQKDEKGVWSLTLGPIAPAIYDMVFDVDGVRMVDPSSENVFGNRRGARGFLEIPGPKGSPRHDEWREVPHGAVTAHWYAGEGGRRRVHVYTPPGYAKEKDRAWPVLYLLHGSGDNDSHWTLLGRANVIADNLFADGKATPMIIVMTDGHVAIPEKDGEDPNERRARANGAYERDLLERVIPLVESEYRVKTDRTARAIVGLSMGGGQSLGVGLRNPDRFAWIGGFSSSTRGWDQGVPGMKAGVEQLNADLRLLWIAIGKDDFLLKENRGFIEWAKGAGLKHTYLETEGAHAWGVWRRYLSEFLPQVFISK